MLMGHPRRPKQPQGHDIGKERHQEIGNDIHPCLTDTHMHLKEFPQDSNREGHKKEWEWRETKNHGHHRDEGAKEEVRY